MTAQNNKKESLSGLS